MATKSVIDIDINDEKFKEFQRLFEKYQQSLVKMPNQWGKINKEVGSLQGNFNKIQHALDTIASRLDKNYKTLQNTDQVVNKTEKHWQNIGKSAASITKNVTATTWNLLKWGSVTTAFGLLGAAGGLFGIGSLAGSANDTRRQSQGLGVSAGELKAAQINFQRVADVNSVLGNVAAAQTDVQKQWAFQAANVNPNQNVAQLLPQLLRRAAEVYKAGEPATAQQRLEVSGLSALGIDVETARRMASLRKGEMDDIERKYNADTKSLALTDALLRRWQDLDVQLGRSKQKIENVFLTGLEGLVTPLEKLSDSFSNAVKVFLESPAIKNWITDVASHLEGWAKDMTKPEFQDAVKKFASQVVTIGEAAVKLAEAVLWLADKIKEPFNPDPSHNIVMTPEEAKKKGAIPFEPSREGMKEGFKAWWNNLSGVNPELANAVQAAGLPVISGKRDENWAKKHGILNPADGKYYTKPNGQGNPVAMENSKHLTGEAVDIANPEKYSDEYLAQYGLYRRLGTKDPGHIELKQKLESESSNNKGSGVPQAPSAPTSNTSSTLGSLNWNPTPIALSINTTKIPGQDTNVDMLKAGGYYTSIGLR